MSHNIGIFAWHVCHITLAYASMTNYHHPFLMVMHANISCNEGCVQLYVASTQPKVTVVRCTVGLTYLQIMFLFLFDIVNVWLEVCFTEFVTYTFIFTNKKCFSATAVTVYSHYHLGISENNCAQTFKDVVVHRLKYLPKILKHSNSTK